MATVSGSPARRRSLSAPRPRSTSHCNISAPVEARKGSSPTEKNAGAASLSKLRTGAFAGNVEAERDERTAAILQQLRGSLNLGAVAAPRKDTSRTPPPQAALRNTFAPGSVSTSLPEAGHVAPKCNVSAKPQGETPRADVANVGAAQRAQSQNSGRNRSQGKPLAGEVSVVADADSSGAAGKGRGRSGSKAKAPDQKEPRAASRGRKSNRSQSANVGAPAPADDDCSKGAVTPCRPLNAQMSDESRQIFVTPQVVKGRKGPASAPLPAGSARMVPLKPDATTPRSFGDCTSEVDENSRGAFADDSRSSANLSRPGRGRSDKVVKEPGFDTDDESAEEGEAGAEDPRSASPFQPGRRAGEHMSFKGGLAGRITPPRKSDAMNPFELSKSELQSEKRKINQEQREFRQAEKEIEKKRKSFGGLKRAAPTKVADMPLPAKAGSPVRRSTAALEEPRLAPERDFLQNVSRSPAHVKSVAVQPSLVVPALATSAAPKRAPKTCKGTKTPKSGVASIDVKSAVLEAMRSSDPAQRCSGKASVNPSADLLGAEAGRVFPVHSLPAKPAEERRTTLANSLPAKPVEERRPSSAKSLPAKPAQIAQAAPASSLPAKPAEEKRAEERQTSPSKSALAKPAVASTSFQAPVPMSSVPGWVSWSANDLAKRGDVSIRFKPENPRKLGSKAWDLYESYKAAKTVAEFLRLHGKNGAMTWRSDALHGLLEVASLDDSSSTQAVAVSKSAGTVQPVAGVTPSVPSQASEDQPSKSPAPKRARRKSTSADQAMRADVSSNTVTNPVVPKHAEHVGASNSEGSMEAADAERPAPAAKRVRSRSAKRVATTVPAEDGSKAEPAAQLETAAPADIPVVPKRAGSRPKQSPQGIDTSFTEPSTSEPIPAQHVQAQFQRAFNEPDVQRETAASVPSSAVPADASAPVKRGRSRSRKSPQDTLPAEPTSLQPPQQAVTPGKMPRDSFAPALPNGHDLTGAVHPAVKPASRHKSLPASGRSIVESRVVATEADTKVREPVQKVAAEEELLSQVLDLQKQQLEQQQQLQRVQEQKERLQAQLKQVQKGGAASESHRMDVLLSAQVDNAKAEGARGRKRSKADGAGAKQGEVRARSVSPDPAANRSVRPRKSVGGVADTLPKPLAEPSALTPAIPKRAAPKRTPRSSGPALAALPAPAQAGGHVFKVFGDVPTRSVPRGLDGRGAGPSMAEIMSMRAVEQLQASTFRSRSPPRRRSPGAGKFRRSSLGGCMSDGDLE